MSQNMADSLIRATRKKNKFSPRSIIAIVLFGAIVMVFVFFGLPNRLGNGMGMGSVARVNSTLISVAEFQREEQSLQKREEYYAQLFGQKASFDPQRQEMIRREAVDSLIRSEVMSQAVQSQKILATDQEIAENVRKFPEFQEDGQFQSQRYFQLLEANRWTPKEFETMLRKQIEVSRSMRLFQAVSEPSQLEVQKLKEMKEQKWNVSFLKLDPEALGKSKAVSDADVKSAMSDPAVVSAAEDYFKAHRSEYQQAEEVHAQHILIKTQPNDSDSEKKALAQIEDLRKRAEKEDFGKLAKEFSQDPGSAKNNGDLGFFGHGRMVPEFEQAAFGGQAGSLSQPVKTTYGYHLIKILEKKNAVEHSFEDVKSSVVSRILAKKKADEAIKNIGQALKDGSEEKLNQEVKDMALKWEETGPFDLGTDNIPKLDGVTRASATIFKLTEKSPLAQELVQQGSTFYVLKLKESKTQPAEAGKDKDKENLANSRAEKLMRGWQENFSKTARIEKNSDMISR